MPCNHGGTGEARFFHAVTSLTRQSAASRGSAPTEEPPGHGVSLPLAPASQGTVGSLLSRGEQPGRARSHFTLLFATC